MIGNPFAVLGLPPGASQLEIKRAYRRLARLSHPDTTAGQGRDRFLELQAAYERLTGGDAPVTAGEEAPDLVEVRVPKDLHRGVRPPSARDAPIECFDGAAEYLLRHHKVAPMTLVHGLAADPAQPTLRSVHAWVEVDPDVIFDPTEQAFFSRDSYYAAALADPKRRYTPADVDRLVTATGSLGPWDTLNAGNNRDTGLLGELTDAEGAHNRTLAAGTPAAVARAAYDDSVAAAMLHAHRSAYNLGIARAVDLLLANPAPTERTIQR